MTNAGISPETISRSLFVAAQEVFTSMLGVELTACEPTEELLLAHHFDGVISLIGLTGACVGKGSLLCSGPVACDLAARFVMSEHTTVNDEVLDVIGELANMIIGGAKNLFEEHLGSIQMSIPATICGKGISVRNIGTEITVPVESRYRGGNIGVAISLSVK